MNRTVVVIGTAIVLVGAIAAAVYFATQRPHARQDQLQNQQAAWVVVRPPSAGKHATVALLRAYGPWNLLCRNLPQQTSANLGVAQTQGAMGPANTCQVFIRTRNTADPHQSMDLVFRYARGNAMLMIAAIHTRANQATERRAAPHPIRRLNRQTNEIIPEAATASDVEVKLGDESLTLVSHGCQHGHCIAFARSETTAVDGIGPKSAIIVTLPALPPGKPRAVRIPAQGLTQALSALRQLTPS